MTFFATTQATASWIIGKSGIVDALHKSFFISDKREALATDTEFVEGPFRVASSGNEDITALWNIDYLSGTGDEAWGFIKIDGAFGISSSPQISREVLERCLYVISQRLQGLTIDGAFFPRRSHDSGAHTCLAGRGTEARHVSIGYFERQVGTDELRQQAIVCIGPEQNWRQLETATRESGTQLPKLVALANQLISPGRKVRVSDTDTLADFRQHLIPFTRSGSPPGLIGVEVQVESSQIDHQDKYNAVGFTYSDWVKPGSCLTPIQRRILESDGIEKHPLRIVGPGGSGKTLLMQLLIIRRLRIAKSKGESVRLLYIVHNQAMAQMVRQRFEVLMSDELLEMPSDTLLEAKTLSQIAREFLELEEAHVIDVDAHEAKEFQYEAVQKALHEEILSRTEVIKDSQLLNAVRDKREVFTILAVLIMTEISIAIKGHGLQKDKQRYVQSAKNLSRFHGILNQVERDFVFGVFERYHRNVFEDLEVLDSDDLAISLLGRLRTPIWELRRRQLGYDYLFIDETQLFNENERRIIPLLTNGIRKHVPVALALDEAQAVYGQSAAGFATLGIEGITNESLGSIHRSTKSIVDLAFFVIQRSTDLFGPDFPNFTDIGENLEPDTHPLAAKPFIEYVHDPKQGLAKFVLKRVRELRKNNIRQICVVVHADQFWDSTLAEFQSSDLPLHLLMIRGQRLTSDQPLVVLSKPAFVGGQEFDAVVLVGLEQGIVPPRMVDNEALSSAVEQQALREIYISLTRARYRVVIAVSHGASVTGVLTEAANHGLIENLNRRNS